MALPGSRVPQCGRTYGRQLTVVRGSLVISGGMVEPKVLDACP
jgi:hypothetical protein